MNISKLEKCDLNCNVFDVYSYDGLSMQELLCQFFTKINECITVSNEGLGFLQWLKSVGLKEEVAKFLNDMVESGELSTIINDVLFNDLSNKINILNNKVNNLLYLNFLTFIEDNNIDIDSGYYEALKTAINYCINNNRTLFIPNGVYNVEREIIITKQGVANLNIIGESRDGVVISFINGDGFTFTTTDKTIDYSKRITKVSIERLTLDGVTRTGNGLRFEYFGYIQTKDLQIYNFNHGISLISGSEYDDYNSQIWSNNVGVYLERTSLEGGSDLANTNFIGSRLYSNGNNIHAINVREVKFDGCAIMNYNGGCLVEGQTQVLNFISCDFENTLTTSDIIAKGSGLINIYGSLFANPCKSKIVLHDTINIKISNTVLDNTVAGIVKIKEGYKGYFDIDMPYINFDIEGDKLFENFNHDNLLNCVNWDFSRGELQGYGVMAYYKVNTTNFVTSNKSIELEPLNQDKTINLSTNYNGVVPTYAEVIIKNNSSDNIFQVHTDKGVFWGFEGGGMELCTQKFSNGFKRIMLILPKDKKILGISLLFRNREDTQYLDSFRIYGNKPNGIPLVGGSKPSKGTWLKGDVIKNNNPVAGSYSHWVCVDNNNTFKGMGKIEE